MQTNNAHEYTDAQIQSAIDAAFPAGARPEGFNLDNRPSSVDWKLEAPNRLAIARAFLAALPKPEAKAKPATFEAHGKTWTRHTPGDPMPCDGEAMVQVILQCELDGLYEYEAGTIRAKAYDWGVDTNEIYSIIGWRYADEPAQPTTSPVWTPAVGDTVRLKSGGPVMTVLDPEEDGEFWCAWFDGIELRGSDFRAASLTPAKEGQP